MATLQPDPCTPATGRGSSPAIPSQHSALPHALLCWHGCLTPAVAGSVATTCTLMIRYDKSSMAAAEVQLPYRTSAAGASASCAAALAVSPQQPTSLEPDPQMPGCLVGHDLTRQLGQHTAGLLSAPGMALSAWHQD